MKFLLLMDELGKRCGIEINFQDGVCTLCFDGEHDVTFEQDAHALLMHAVVNDGACLTSPSTQRLLLTASYLGAETDGGALAVREITGEVVLWKRFEHFTGITQFEEATNDFLAQLIHWKGKLTTKKQIGETIQNASDNNEIQDSFRHVLKV